MNISLKPKAEETNKSTSRFDSNGDASLYLKNGMTEHGHFGYRGQITDDMNAPMKTTTVSTANNLKNDTNYTDSVLNNLDDDFDRSIQDRYGCDYDASRQHHKPTGNFKHDADQADFVSFSSLKNLGQDVILKKSPEQHNLYLRGCDYDASQHQLPMPNTKRVKHNTDQADLISFSSLKNLDEAKITKSSIDRYLQDSHSCDYDTMYEIQRQPADLTKMCTTSTTVKVSPAFKSYRDIYEAPIKPKANVIADPASQFYNNFFG